MEYINCILCGSNGSRILFKKKDKFGITDDEFCVVECLECGLLFVNPRPSEEEIGKFYPNTYSWKETFDTNSYFTRLIRHLEKNYRYHLLKDEVLKVIKNTGIKVGKVLDVGCGTGDRLDVFRSYGFDTYGVEISDAADYAKEYMKLNVLKGGLFAANFPDCFFDIITLYNVLEHTHNPLRVCQEINRILKDDGFLIIQIPNKDSIQCHIFMKRWSAFDVPRDLYYFNISTMNTLFQKTGFKIRKIDHYMSCLHPPTLVNSLFPNLEPQRAWSKEDRGESTISKRIGWAFLTIILSPLTHIESALKHGAILTYYAIKDKKIG